jgi:hypothetical protein
VSLIQTRDFNYVRQIRGLVCAKQKTMKTVVGKIRRSSVYYLMGPIASLNEAHNARSDIWGTVVVLVLLLGLVCLVRLFLIA